MLVAGSVPYRYKKLINLYLFCLENILICTQREYYCTFRVNLGNLMYLLFLRV